MVRETPAMSRLVMKGPVKTRSMTRLTGDDSSTCTTLRVTMLTCHRPIRVRVPQSQLVITASATMLGMAGLLGVTSMGGVAPRLLRRITTRCCGPTDR
jgi:hypothetical protein